MKTTQRVIILLGSFACGIAITNILYLWFLTSGKDDEEEVFAMNFSVNNDDSKTYSVSRGLLTLLTVGSASHAVFDRFIWTLSACGICRAGGRFESHATNRNGCCSDLGKYLVILLVLGVVVVATLVVVIRATVEEGNGGDDLPVFHNMTINFSEILQLHKEEFNDWSFVKGYALEFVVSLFLYYPLFESVLFSGVLGCSTLPVLGGRPREIAKERKAQSRELGIHNSSALPV